MPVTVDYLAVEANEGYAAGGHVALRLDDTVYHLQNADDGLLRLTRDPTLAFRLQYALFENRPIHVTRLAVDPATADRLRSALTERVMREAADSARLAALDADVALFAALAQDSGTLRLPVRAAAYFRFAPQAPGDNAAVAAVRERFLASAGAGALVRRSAALRAQLAALPLRPADDDTWDWAAAATASTRVRELAEQITALEILAAAPPLRADALLADPGAPPLSPAERAALTATAVQMRGGLAALPDSPRPDWGYALLLGLARLTAIEASLAAGEIRVLDAWPAGDVAPALPPARVRADFFAALDAQTASVLARERATCLGGARCAAYDYARLESALNRRADLLRAVHDGTAPRGSPDLLPPERRLWRDDLALAPHPAAAADLGAARHAALAAREALARQRGYRLVTRNCVTELLALLDAADGRAPARPAWQAIPFVSADALAAQFPVVRRETWPSLRAAAPQATWSAWLAEHTTLTAAGYRPSGRDSTFLFFTDDTVAARPLFGAANLAVGLADGTVGLATWPFDGARRLTAGFKGALFSLPELAFVSLRKGTSAYVTEEEVEAMR
ncbi:MAG: hypothetical protein SF182_09770 [Deltaproteobacteria bacterium]|nr:hypothetical protein [Deltaproteobacteria bacterium]